MIYLKRFNEGQFYEIGNVLYNFAKDNLVYLLDDDNMKMELDIHKRLSDSGRFNYYEFSLHNYTLDNNFEINTNTAYGTDIICVTIQNKLKNSEWSDARANFEFDESILSLFSLLKKRYRTKHIVEYDNIDDFLKEAKRVYMTKVEILIKV